MQQPAAAGKTARNRATGRAAMAGAWDAGLGAAALAGLVTSASRRANTARPWTRYPVYFRLPFLAPFLAAFFLAAGFFLAAFFTDFFAAFLAGFFAAAFFAGRLAAFFTAFLAFFFAGFLAAAFLAAGFFFV